MKKVLMPLCFSVVVSVVLGGSIQAAAPRVPQLIRLIMRGNLENIQKFLDLGANVNVATDEGITPLIYVAMMPDTPANRTLIRDLLNAGADKNVRDQNGMTAEDYARRQGMDEVADMIRDYRLGSLTKPAR